MFLLNRKKKNSVRFQFDFTLHGLDNEAARKLPPTPVSVSWKRGTKTGQTQKVFPSEKGVQFETSFTLSTRLQKNNKAPANQESYLEKTIRFVLREDVSKGHSREVAKAYVDLAPLASNNAVLQSRRVVLRGKGTGVAVPILLSVTTSRMAGKKDKKGKGAASSTNRGMGGDASDDDDTRSAVSTSASYVTSEAATEDSEDAEIVDITLDDSYGAGPSGVNTSEVNTSQGDEPVDLPEANDDAIVSGSTTTAATTGTTSTTTTTAATATAGGGGGGESPASPSEHTHSVHDTSRSVTPISFNNENVINSLISQHPEWQSLASTTSPASDDDAGRRGSIPFEVIEDEVMRSSPTFDQEHENGSQASPHTPGKGKGHARRASVAHFPQRAPTHATSGLAAAPTNANDTEERRNDINAQSRTEVFLAEIDRLNRSVSESKQGFDRQKHELQSLRTELSRRVGDIRLLRLIEHTVYKAPRHQGPYIPMAPVITMKSFLHWKAFDPPTGVPLTSRRSDAALDDLRKTETPSSLNKYLQSYVEAWTSHIELIDGYNPLLASRMCDLVTLQALINDHLTKQSGGLAIPPLDGTDSNQPHLFRAAIERCVLSLYSSLCRNACQIFTEHGHLRGILPSAFLDPIAPGSDTAGGASRAQVRGVLQICQYLCQELQNAQELLPGLSREVMRAIMKRLNAMMVNDVLQHNQACSMSSGLRIKMTVAALTEWLTNYEQGILQDIVCELEQLKQLADVLVMNKNAFADADTHDDVCPSLSLLQLKHVLTMYSPDADGDEAVPSATLESLAQRHQNTGAARPGHAELLLDTTTLHTLTLNEIQGDSCAQFFTLTASLNVGNLVVPPQLCNTPEFAFLGFSIG